jgi:outer membrane protein assembly factor BamB
LSSQYSFLYKDVVIMQCNESGGNSFIVAFNKKSGKEAWRVARKVDVTWTSPVLVQAKNRTELVTAAAEAIIAYDPLTGRELWRHKGLESKYWRLTPTELSAAKLFMEVESFYV